MTAWKSSLCIPWRGARDHCTGPFPRQWTVSTGISDLAHNTLNRYYPLQGTDPLGDLPQRTLQTSNFERERFWDRRYPNGEIIGELKQVRTIFRAGMSARVVLEVHRTHTFAQDQEELAARDVES